MKGLEMDVLEYLLNSLWQAPLIFFAAWAAARIAQRAGPRTEHRIWVTALALEAILPACNFHAQDVWRAAWGLLAHAGAPGSEVRVVAGPGLAEAPGAFHLSGFVSAMLLVAYLATVLYFAGRLIWGLVHTQRMLRVAEPLTLEGQLATCWRRVSTVLDAPREPSSRRPEIAMSPTIQGPVTLGVRRCVLLVPPGFLDGVSGDDLDALLAHEFAHMQRHDFAKNMAHCLVSLPVAYHPLTWLTRGRVAESRELVCDAMAADALAGREYYARSLLRLASTMTRQGSGKVLHAMGIFDARNFERRITMLTQNRVEMGTTRRVLVAAACGVVALAACTSALALRMHVDGMAAVSGMDSPKASGPVTVPAKAMQDHKISGAPPKYPKEAKEERIQGRVLLNAVIGKDGSVEELKVASGPKELQQSALDAVRKWMYKPYLLNGKPVAVKTTVTVIYSLQK